jgi:hypothetical protein
MKPWIATALAATIATASVIVPTQARSAPKDVARIKALEDAFAVALRFGPGRSRDR